MAAIKFLQVCQFNRHFAGLMIVKKLWFMLFGQSFDLCKKLTNFRQNVKIFVYILKYSLLMSLF